MKSPGLLFLVAGLAGMLVLAGIAAAEDATAPAPIFPPTLANSPGAQKILATSTPSEAVAAYAASAPTVSGDDLNVVEQAYVRRMIDFGLPEMTEAQAAELTRHVPDDGLAWGALGFMSARRNRIDDALTQIAKAVEHAPSEAFVARTAGELLAWLDTRTDQSKVSAEARQAADSIRSKMGNDPGFTDAYNTARDRYASLDDHAATSAPMVGQALYAQPFQPTPPQQEYAHPDPGVVQQPVTVYNNYYYDYPAYTDPYAYYGAPYYYSPWWPSSYIYINSGFRGRSHGAFHDFRGFHRVDHFGRMGHRSAFIGGFNRGLTPFNAIRFAPTNSLHFGVSRLPARFGGASMRFAPRMGGMPMGSVRTAGPMRGGGGRRR